MSSDNAQLERIRKLLAKAEARGVTPAEAEAFTAKAAELMARYGIDRASWPQPSLTPTSPPTASSSSPARGQQSMHTCCAASDRRCGAGASC